VGASLAELQIPMHEVDAHNVVPVWVTSEKIEYAALTIRKKLHGKLRQYLVVFPPMQKQPHLVSVKSWWRLQAGNRQEIDWDQVRQNVTADTSVAPIVAILPGQKAGLGVLQAFAHTIRGYAAGRNDPNEHFSSNLSPYFNFGQVSAQFAIMQVQKYSTPATRLDVAAFVEEALVRRELSDNYCFYNQDGYD
jgi:deoxyribodipyrimidine photo-lyase